MFIGTGKHARREIAFAARTVKAHTRLPVAVFADAPIKSDCIDVFRQVEPTHKRLKIDHFADSPFESTLYLDSDVTVQRDLSDLFGILERFDMAGVHDHCRKSSEWAGQIPDYEAIPYAFSEVNTGVLLYRRNAATNAFFAGLWRTHFYPNFRAHAGGKDQASFKRRALESPLNASYRLPFEYNVRTPEHPQPDPQTARKPQADEGLASPPASCTGTTASARAAPF